MPKGKAKLFTQFVRQTLIREIEGGNRLLLPTWPAYRVGTTPG